MKRLVSLLSCLIAGICLLLGQEPSRGSAIYRDNAKSVFLLYVQGPSGDFVAEGSGFLVAGDRIVTNAHVADLGKVFVQLGPARIPATQIALDAANDLALLKLDAQLSAPPLALATSAPSPGDEVFVISNPEGLERSISQGMVAGWRTDNGRQLLQITAPISHGSSGGPVFNQAGAVVGIADAYLEGGENLNFAVPTAELTSLLAGRNGSANALASTLAQVQQHEQQADSLTYSTAADSPYVLNQQQVDALLQQALSEAGERPDDLLLVSKAAHNQNEDVAIIAATRAVSLNPTSDEELALAYALETKALANKSNAKLLVQAETAAKAAVRLNSSAEDEAELGDVLSEESDFSNAIVAHQRALDLDQTTPDAEREARLYRSLASDCYGSHQDDVGLHWFNRLVAAGSASALDWANQADRLQAAGDWKDAGDALTTAATAGFGRGGEALTLVAWCEAGRSFMVAGSPDDALSAARKCVELGTGKEDADAEVAEAHSYMAVVFNQRGLYTEALGEAQQASSLAPTNAFYFQYMAEALNGLQRYTEAVSAAQSALRLSDGKYASMHFDLGSAYFSLQSWQLAEQSFEQAATLNPKNASAAYNVALCYQRLGYFPSAVNWYREYLKRDPDAEDRDQVLNRIALLSGGGLQ